MPRPLKILLVEDNPLDAELLLRELRRSGFEPDWKRVETKDEYLGALDSGWQIILSDYALPQFGGLVALQLLCDRGIDIPFIIVSGTIGEETAVSAMRQGAVDYLLKDRLGRLGQAVSQALEQHRLREERKAAEEALRKANIHLHHLVARSPTVIYSVKPDEQAGFLNYVSANISELLGFTVEEMLDPDWWSGHLHPADMESARTGLRRALEEGSSRAEYRLRRKNGGYIWVEDRKRFQGGTSGESSEIVGGWTDITIRKEAEEARVAAENKYRRIFENAVGGIYQATADGRLLTANAALARMAGYDSPDEAIAGVTRVEEQFYADDERRVEFQRLLREQGFVRGFEAQMRRRDGRLLWISSNARVVRDETGGIYYEGTLQDISEQKELEKKFMRTQRMEAIGTLAGGVAHDLNNILAPMLMAAGLLKEKLVDAEDREMLTMVERSAQRGALIIGQLLSFSRGTSGERVSTQMRHLLKEMHHLMRETFPRNIEIREELPTELSPVLADPTQLHQLIMNLCVNARDAMPDGGKLTLSAGNCDLDEKLAHLHPEAKRGPYVRLSVADTGTGIPPEILPNIFDPFFTTKAVGKGTGLGLSTVIGIVKSHDGIITVDSEPGRGTAFTVYLPATKAMEVAEAVSASMVAAQGKQELILLVDDEALILTATRQALEKHNFRVLSASNGEDAVRLFARHAGAIRIVITDVMMPGMGGLKLVRALRVLQPGIKVIACSGLMQDDKRAEFAALGINGILAKPFSPALLFNTVQQMLTEQ